jgi:hypothetical protein
MSDLTPSLSGFSRRIRWAALGMTSAPLLGAAGYAYLGWKVPFLGCPIRHFTGAPCPSCGMTRSFVAIAKGDAIDALNHHLFGPLLFVALGTLTLHVAFELYSNRPISTPYSRCVQQLRWQLIGVAAFFVYYAARMAYWTLTGDLSTSVAHSPLGQWLASLS